MNTRIWHFLVQFKAINLSALCYHVSNFATRHRECVYRKFESFPNYFGMEYDVARRLSGFKQLRT